MKPLKLKIDGIKSFSDEVEIDFGEISKYGLFGIFGQTGSGKSTILDSIIIALYGKINGLDMSEIISSRKQKAFVSLEFEMKIEGISKKFVVERNFKLKKDRSYGGATATLYENVSGTLVMLASQTTDVNTKIEEVLGLGLNEFTKCIVLPQGEFSQFVNATKSERVKIIEKLFDLEKYGDRFTAKLKGKLSLIETELAQKIGELTPYLDITEEVINREREGLKELEKTISKENEKLLIINDYIEKNESFYSLFKDVSADKITLEKLLEKSERIEGLNQVIFQYENAFKIKTSGDKLKNIYKDKSSLEDKIKKVKDESKAVNETKVIIDKEYQTLDELASTKTELVVRLQLLRGAVSDVKRINDLKKEIKEKQAIINSNDGKIEKITSSLDIIAAELRSIIARIIRYEKLTDVNVTFGAISVGALSKVYDEEISYYEEQIENVSKNGDGSSFCVCVLEEYERRKLYFQEKKENLPKHDLNVEDAISNYRIASDHKKKFEERKAEKESDAKKLETEKLTLEKDNEGLRNLIKKASEELELLSGKLSKITDNLSDFEKEMYSIADAVKRIETKEKRIRENYAEITKRLTEIIKKESELKSEEEVLIEREKSQKEEFNSLLTDEVNSYEKATKIVDSVIDVESGRKEIADYHEEKDYLVKKISKAEEKLKENEFSIETYEQKQSEKSNIETNREKLFTILGNSQNNIEKLSQNFEKRCIIEKDVKKLSARASVLKRLDQVVGRRAFAEFIAAEFLSDVASDARKTLLELTGGKYDVVYKDSSTGGKDGFFVLDNLNGGIERSVASLSGGETFLVSLSLALSLSLSIYSTCNKPMEFFFLDEGFGTLDDGLVDTVLDSLEKLREKNLTIGLISHLAEMKNRIACKIIVTQASETSGSTVKIVK